MKKRVNVFPYSPIMSLKYPIVGPTFNIELSIGDILNCMCGKARVEEILNDGTTVILNLSNYKSDNNKNIKKKNIHNVQEVKKPEPIKPQVQDVKKVEVKKTEPVKPQPQVNKQPEVKKPEPIKPQAQDVKKVEVTNKPADQIKK